LSYPPEDFHDTTELP